MGFLFLYGVFSGACFFHGMGLASLSLLVLHICAETWASNWLKTESFLSLSDKTDKKVF